MNRLLVAGSMLVPALAHGQGTPTRNVEVSMFDPTPATANGTFQLQSPEVGRDGAYVLSANLSYANAPLVLTTVQTPTDEVIKHQTLLSIGGAYALKGIAELGAHLPLYMQSGQPLGPGVTVAPASGAAVGDLTLHGKVRFTRSDRMQLGGGLVVKASTAHFVSDGQFTGSESDYWPSARLLVLGSYAPSRALTLFANAGAVARKPATLANISFGSGATWALGMAFRAADPLFLTVEAWGDVIPDAVHSEPISDTMDGPTSTLFNIEALGGARYLVGPDMTIGLAVGRGLNDGVGTPAIRGVFTFTYTPGRPELPVLHPPLPPPPPPDPTKEDSDYDRIVDANDKCPNEREDKDGFEDDDGCPDLDNDKDGVPDEQDKCPNVAEDKDGFEDSDGCPDPDNDKDGIPDDKDKCPTKPEKINGVNDEDGCPDAGDSLIVSSPERLELLEPVQFSGTGVSRKSYNLLGQLAATLRARADIVKLRITVHVQPTKSPEKDQALTDNRSAALREWLVGWGIKAERLEVRGFGGTKPLVPPTQKGAAEINDRIDLIITDRKL